MQLSQCPSPSRHRIGEVSRRSGSLRLTTAFTRRLLLLWALNHHVGHPPGCPLAWFRPQDIPKSVLPWRLPPGRSPLPPRQLQHLCQRCMLRRPSLTILTPSTQLQPGDGTAVAVTGVSPVPPRDPCRTPAVTRSLRWRSLTWQRPSRLRLLRGMGTPAQLAVLSRRCDDAL